MTGRELILYILENHLEDEPIYKNGKLLGYMTEGEAAEKFGVGLSTIKVWVNQELLQGILVGATIYIPENSKNPKDLVKGK